MMNIRKGLIFILITIASYEISSSDFSSWDNKFGQFKHEKQKISTLKGLFDWVESVKTYCFEENRSRDLVEYLGQIAASEKNPDFSSYLYFIISDIYWTNGNKEVALFYMTKISEKSYDIIYADQPIGYLIALRIIGFDCNYKFQEQMYELLLKRYRDKIDILYTMNDLSNLYKKQLNMESAVKVMEEILLMSRNYKSLEENINLSEIKQEVDFFYLKKNWIYKDIKSLIRDIKTAIKRKDIGLLKSYTSKNGFDVIFFQKTDQNKWRFDELAIGSHITDNIVFSDKFEEFSNDDEIYLRSDNWNFTQMTTWYFYFKRIDYPYDEKIDGGWEWKGIFFGDFF
jgi:hypothetical protein